MEKILLTSSPGAKGALLPMIFILIPHAGLQIGHTFRDLCRAEGVSESRVASRESNVDERVTSRGSKEWIPVFTGMTKAGTIRVYLR